MFRKFFAGVAAATLLAATPACALVVYDEATSGDLGASLPPPYTAIDADGHSQVLGFVGIADFLDPRRDSVDVFGFSIATTLTSWTFAVLDYVVEGATIDSIPVGVYDSANTKLEAHTVINPSPGGGEVLTFTQALAPGDYYVYVERGGSSGSGQAATA